VLFRSEGAGRMKIASGLLDGPFTYKSRFEGDAKATNPEELLGAAHAGCFSMALSAALGKAGHQPTRIHTTASVHLEKVGEGFGITRIDLDCEAEIPGISEEEFQQTAKGAKDNCPLSKALAAVGNITLNARLVSS